ALDVLFCLLTGAAAFVYGMQACGGRLGLWELGAMLLGFLLYLHLFSPIILRGLTAALDFCVRFMTGCKKR
ncbi:MAG: hypothetical protein IJ594_01730, partial [Oscillospiraceae bacterium]|nr:hypothetical protein [Oscillospiraceae bacterium]